MSMRVLRETLAQHQWQIHKLYADGPNDLLLTRPDGKIIPIASSTPPTTSVYALHLADDKFATYSLLQSLDVPQPETVLIHQEDEAKAFLAQHSPIVIKPVDGAHGRGVTTNITSADQISPAFKKAIAGSASQKLALAQAQVQLEADELRVICINYQFVIAVARIPAMVASDGMHTVAELIDLENSTLRATPYTSNLAFIDRDLALPYLGERANEIPASGTKVRVSPTCNIGQGGTAEDYSDRISPEVKATAEKIARASQLPVIGIDFYGDYVLEINACPSLYYPINTDPTKVVKAYVDYLETL